MIVAMKRLAVLCTASSRQETLSALQDLGVLHVDVSVREGSDDLKSAQTRLDTATKALSILEGIPKQEKTSSSGQNKAPAPEDVVAASAAVESAAASLASVSKQVDRYAFFGDFSPESVASLASSGINVTLFKISPDELPASLPGTIIKVLDGDVENKKLCAAAIGPAELPASAEIIPLPEKSLSEMLADKAAAESALASAEAALAAFAPSRDMLKTALAERTSVRDFFQARDSMASDGDVTWLTGFCPAEKVPDLRAAAQKNGWGLLVRDPSDDETPPTLIRPPAVFRPIVALFDMLSIAPGYREADVSVVFYSFFTLFFAMLVGDAGYGLLILAATIWARLKFKKAPSSPFILLGIFSAATIVWGVLTATYFGIPQEALKASMPFLQHPVSEWLGDQANIMKLCFLLGACHLSIARIWNAALLFPDTKFLAQVGWTGVIWTMYCVSCVVVVPGFVFPSYMKIVAAVSVLLIALFTLKKNELREGGAELGMLPLNVISVLGDIISYVRLFAVGLASVKVAENFNTMSMGLDLPLWAKIPCVVIILLIGHGLNLAMGALSILVHAVRLNTLEFSNHKGVSWSGFAYRPFRK